MTAWRWGWIVIALAFLGASDAARAQPKITTSDQLVATFYSYMPYAPTEYSASWYRETSRYRVLRLTFPSRIQSPSPNNNLVRGYYYQPKRTGRVPAVIMLHGLGGVLTGGKIEEVCRAFAERGVAAFMLILPYHLERRAEGKHGGQGFISSDPQRLVQSGRQAVIDIRGALDWLEARPEVDSSRLGVVGISLGALMTNLAMGVDTRLVAGVSLLGGGDLARVFWKSPLTLPWKRKLPHAGFSEATLRETLRPIDPLSFADRNRPRRVLMINGYYDRIIPPSSARTLWEALDQPPIIWINSGHASQFFEWNEIINISFDFMQAQFEGEPAWTPREVHVKPLKAMMLWDEREGFQIGLFKELLCSRERGQFSLDLGLTTDGIVLNANGLVTKNTIAIGMGTPLGKGPLHFEPYVALQMVF